jgi:hypothetical protein
VWLKTVARGVELDGDLGDGGGDGGRREQLWTTTIGRGLWFDYRQGPARQPSTRREDFGSAADGRCGDIR